jgi:hypothetical protein
VTKPASQLDREIAEHLANKSRMSDAEVLRSVARAKTAHKAARTRAERAFNTAANEAFARFGSSDVELAARQNTIKRLAAVQDQARTDADQAYRQRIEAIRSVAGIWADLVPP